MTISGALILFLIALPMIFPTIRLSMESEGAAEPFIVPLATPLFAGPSALAFVMVMGTENITNWVSWLGTVCLAWAGASIVVLLGHVLARWIGERGLVAIERLTGMFLVAIAVEMLLSGLSRYAALSLGPETGLWPHG
jgi:multiple antibiotic resistance protein